MRRTFAKLHILAGETAGKARRGRVVAAAAFALALTASPAMAESFNFGTISATTPASGGGTWVGATEHSDGYSFSLGGPSTTLTLGLSNTGIADFMGGIYQGNSLLIAIDYLASGASRSTVLHPLAAGDYTLVLTGSPTGYNPYHHALGTYTVSLTSAVAAVPGPSGWAVGIGGMAMIGFAARRRRGAPSKALAAG